MKCVLAREWLGWKMLCVMCIIVVTGAVIWDRFQELFFHRNSNSMEILFCSHPNCSEVIAMKFCTWHDSCVVMTCAKFCRDMILYNGVTMKRIFHWIWIMMEKSFMKWAPGTIGIISACFSWCLVMYQPGKGDVIYVVSSMNGWDLINSLGQSHAYMHRQSSHHWFR